MFELSSKTHTFDQITWRILTAFAFSDPQERLSEQLEEQRQEQALQRYHSEAEELDNWLLSTRATLSSTLQPHPQDMDMEEQLIDCQVRVPAFLWWHCLFFMVKELFYF